MDELIAILDSDGKQTGKTAMKSKAHANGWFHPTVHIWFYTKAGNILIQQRGKLKNINPLLWDVSVAGHIGAGETIELSAVREVEEEIGLKIQISDLYKIGVFKSVQKYHEKLIDCEFHHTFLCELKTLLQQLKKQESEVEQLALMPIAQFEKGILEGDTKYVPHDIAYYQFIIKAIKEKL